MDSPLISIVMCTYNGEAFVKAQIDSLLQQTYSNLEIIISDDASTDNTRSILNTYIEQPYIQLFFQERNLGLTENFEFAITKSHGAYIAFCDQDDVWLPEKITELYEHFPVDSLLIYSNSLLIDDNGNSLNKTISDLRNMYTGNDTRHFALFNIVSGHTMMIKRKLLQYCLPLSKITYHDWRMAIVATVHSNIFYYDKVLQYYRQHANTATKNIKQKNVPARTYQKRYSEHQLHLCRIEELEEVVRPEQKGFFARLYKLIKANESKGYNYSLFFFLYKYQNIIYRLTKKNFASRIVDIRKRARRERAV